MDIFDACDALAGLAGAGGSHDGGIWEDRLNSIALPGIPTAVTETYLRRLIPLYARLGTANPVRDVLCNIAIQQSTYRISPWTGKQGGVFLQSGGLGSSAFPASLVCNWRVMNVFNLGWLSPGCPSLSDGMEMLKDAIAYLKDRGFTGEPVLMHRELKELTDELSSDKMYERSVLHIADIGSRTMAEQTVAVFADLLAGHGISLFSGPRPVARTLAGTLRRRFPQKHVRMVETVTMTDGQADRAEALLVMRDFPPEFTAGAPYTEQFERLRANERIIETMWMDALDRADETSTGYLSLAGTAFTTSSTNFGVRGADRLRSRYRDTALDSSWPCDTGTPSRYRISFGHVGSFPNGSVIERTAVTADGRIPLGAININHVPPLGQGHWLETGDLPDRPVVELPGTWLALPDAGAPLSHWLLENFLPLLALRGLGMEFNLMMARPPTDYQRTYLELAGFPPKRMFVADDSKIHRCDRLLVPFRDEEQHMLNSYVRVHHPASRDGIDALMRAHGGAPRQRTNRLYVSRMDARRYRACLNEEEVIEFFRSKGFQIVNGNELTPTQALTTYGNARIVFGPLGAGILNAVFAPPGCQIGTFGSLSYREEFVEQIANLIGHDHVHLVCESFRSLDVEEGGTRNSNFVADIPALAEMLDEAEARASVDRAGGQ